MRGTWPFRASTPSVTGYCWPAGIFLYSSFLVGRAPNDGWFNYVPLSGRQFTPGINIDFYAVGLIFLGVSSTGGAINFIVTILKLRAPGMILNRIPIFVWGEMAMALQIVFALPALTLAAVLLLLDRKFDFHFYDADAGGDPAAVAAPVLGLRPSRGVHRRPARVRHRLGDHPDLGAPADRGLHVHRHRRARRGAHRASGCGSTTCSRWACRNITVGFISLASFMVAIPSSIQVFAWLATLVAGRPVLRTPLLFVLGFIFIFVIGGVTGVMFAAVPFDQAVHDSYFVVAHLHYVLVGSAVFPIFGALYHWGPKMTGRLLDERWGKVSFWLMFVGFNLAFFPQHLLGLFGMPRRIYTYDEGLGWDGYNLVSTIGAFMLAVGILVTDRELVLEQGAGRAGGATIRGGARRSSGTPRRHRPTTTSSPSRRSGAGSPCGTSRSWPAGRSRPRTVGGRSPAATSRCRPACSTPGRRRSSTCRTRRSGRSCCRWRCWCSPTPCCWTCGRWRLPPSWPASPRSMGWVLAPRADAGDVDDRCRGDHDDPRRGARRDGPARRAAAAALHGPRAFGWWGMVWLIGTEATLFALLIASYFYLRFRNGPIWPPDGIATPGAGDCR